VNDILAAVVTHGAILLFLYVLADQLGVPIPAAPVLMAAGGLAQSQHPSALPRARWRLSHPGS
jgi:membrane protein DedA with SNARE-associated domain